ncbi:TPA: acetyl-CoA carboxylase carboxyl transferase subunit alpha, partial [Bacillus wiedmannii]|nr:acetyl-CoA carboxylase carboxyl transferase subunit alpha [Bacillus wiedmannii]
QAKVIESVIESSLKKLILLSSEELIQQRYEKYRQIENYK